MKMVYLFLKVLAEGGGVVKSNLGKCHFFIPARYVLTKKRAETMSCFPSYGIEGLSNIKFLTTCRTARTFKVDICSELRFCPLVDAGIAEVVAAVVQFDGKKLGFEAYVTFEGRWGKSWTHLDGLRLEMRLNFQPQPPTREETNHNDRVRKSDGRYLSPKPMTRHYGYWRK
jgi:hypothetical protein